jgi:hypothetical protein
MSETGILMPSSHHRSPHQSPSACLHLPSPCVST